MRIKKKSNKNEYLLTPQNMWVRNFTKDLVPNIDINKTITSEDHFVFLKNEFRNTKSRYAWIDTEKIYHKKVVIVCDGYGFAEKHKLLTKLPKDVAIIGVNGSLKKWSINRSMNYYVINNPYKECMRFLPNIKSLPKCIASTRTNEEFLYAYKGTKYLYYPVNEEKYCGIGNKNVEYQVDDYRNPICAAIFLAYKFGAEEILLFCCDDSFDKERPGAIKLQNGYWAYQPQMIAHGLIDGMFYWLKHLEYNKISTFDHSKNPLYSNVVYINEDDIASYLEHGVFNEKKD